MRPESATDRGPFLIVESYQRYSRAGRGCDMAGITQTGRAGWHLIPDLMPDTNPRAGARAPRRS
jgi:hypothetical protein